MSFQQDLVDLSITEYSFLVDEYKFSPAIITERVFITRVFFLHKYLAIEVKFDWREFCVFLSIVRLIDGKLPEQYYGNPEGRMRLSLLLLIKGLKWQVDQVLMDKIIKIGHKKRSDLSPEDLKIQLLLYHTLLSSCINKILEVGSDLFDNDLIVLNTDSGD